MRNQGGTAHAGCREHLVGPLIDDRTRESPQASSIPRTAPTPSAHQFEFSPAYPCGKNWQRSGSWESSVSVSRARSLRVSGSPQRSLAKLEERMLEMVASPGGESGRSGRGAGAASRPPCKMRCAVESRGLWQDFGGPEMSLDGVYPRDLHAVLAAQKQGVVPGIEPDVQSSTAADGVGRDVRLEEPPFARLSGEWLRGRGVGLDPVRKMYLVAPRFYPSQSA